MKKIKKILGVLFIGAMLMMLNSCGAMLPLLGDCPPPPPHEPGWYHRPPKPAPHKPTPPPPHRPGPRW